MRKLITRNAMVRPLLEPLRDMIYGSGVGFFKRAVDARGQPQLIPYTDALLDEWSEATELQDYFIYAINQRLDTANVHTNPYFGHFPSFISRDTDTIRAFNRLDWEYNKARTLTISHSKEKIAGQPHYAFAS